MSVTVEVYRTRNGEFAWRRRAGNGKVRGRSEESFKRYATCRDHLRANCVIAPRIWSRFAKRLVGRETRRAGKLGYEWTFDHRAASRP